MFYLRNTLAAATLLIGASTSGAFAANWPTTLAGSSWTGDANGTPLTLSVTSEGGGGTCATITGTFTINGANPSAAKGYYCPSSGTVVAFRSVGGVTFQVFNGAISQSPEPSLLGYVLSGVFGQYTGAGITGFYPFSLQTFLTTASARR